MPGHCCSRRSMSKFTVFLVSPQVRGVKGVFLANQKVDGKVTTVITYNKGRDWDYLRPPSTDMNGKPTNCQPVSNLLCHMPPREWHRCHCQDTFETHKLPVSARHRDTYTGKHDIILVHGQL